MKKVFVGFFLVLFLSSFPDISFGQAVKIDTLKYKPSEYPGLPAPVAAWLEQRGMIIPRFHFYEDWSDNVLQGEFFEHGQTDWAVLCTDGDSLRVWVFPKGKAENPSLVIAEAEKQHNRDSHWSSQAQEKNTISYFLFIQKVSERDLEETRYSLHLFGEPAVLPVFEHQGIWFGIWDKPGRPMQYYNHCGVWMKIPYFID